MIDVPLRQSPEALERLAAILAAPTGIRIGVLGLGISGNAMALYLARRGAEVIAIDKRAEMAPATLNDAGVQLRLGRYDGSTFADLEALCLSPGVDPRQSFIAALMKRHIPIFGELELVGPLPCKVIGITGTNGKSTTTALTHALVQGLGNTAFIGGNFGYPVAEWVDNGQPADVAVLELSSYQLETVSRFRLDVAVQLNVTPDHLERYADIKAYARTKCVAIELLGPSGIAVLNYDDPYVCSMAERAQGKIYWFSSAGAVLPGDGLSVVGDKVVGYGALSDFGTASLAHPRLLGRHNRENALASFLAVYALGLAPTLNKLLPHYQAFKGLEHRLELAGSIKGVRYINDSKATNDMSTAIALKSFDSPVILLIGGKDKGGGYAETLAAARGRVRQVIAFGAAGPLIARTFSPHFKTVLCTSMATACKTAHELARFGDVVLLSPACSSFDEFRDFTHRGRVFKEWVARLVNE